MATPTTEQETVQSARGAGYYFLLFMLLAFSGFYFGFAIPMFMGIVNAN